MGEGSRNSLRGIARRRRSVAAVFLFALGLALPVAVQAQVKVLPLDSAVRGSRLLRAPSLVDSTALREVRPLLEKRWQSELSVRQLLGPHGISQKGLRLRDRRVERRNKGLALAEPETLKVLLVRIAFDTDRSGSLTSITEDGNFLLTPDPDAIFDRPPHDKAYFEAHLGGLKEYWRSMSAGQLVIESQVLPPGDRDAYRLNDIADYGPGSGGTWTIAALEKLVQDMIVATDDGTQADGSVNLADFDDDDDNTYVIFAHAGGDLQSNLVFTEGDPDYSPNDIPTFFVTLGDSASVTLTSTDSETGATGQITEVSVIPESTSQDGLLGSIAAAFYHEFGHALGLPDLYSTVTGLPTLGYWDIMDTGTNLTAAVGVEVSPGEIETQFVTGLLPPQTSAWSKWYLGFVDEIRVGGRRQSPVLRPWRRQNPADKVLRLDVSPDEFFLVTNRWVPFVGNPNWALKSDPATGVIQYLGNFVDENNPVNSHMYDFFLPWGGGLMVWRVRQDRIDESIAFNQVQSLPRKLGVELVEADGIKDLGIFDFTTVGLVGSETDAFRAFTASPQADIPDYPQTSTSFSSSSFPPSTSSIGLPTGARLENIPITKDGTVQVDAWVEGLLDVGAGSGFPVEVERASAAPMRGDVRSMTDFDFAAGEAVLIAASGADTSPGLYAYAFDGSPRFAGARVADFNSPLSGPPLVVGDLLGAPALVVTEVDGTVHAYDDAGPSGAPPRLTERNGFPAALADSVDGGAIAFGSVLVAASLADDRIEVLGFDGQRRAAASTALTAGLQLRSAPIVGRIIEASSAAPVLAYASDRGLELRSADGSAALASGVEFVPWSTAPSGSGQVVAAASSDSSLSDRFFFVGDSGESRIFESTVGGWGERGFGADLGDAPIAPPAVADVDGDGELDLIVVTATQLHARGSSGASLYGFPIDVTDRYLLREEREDSWTSAPVVADADGDGKNEILLVSSFGLLHGVESDGGFVEGFPQQRSGGGAVAPLLIDTGGPDSRRALLLFDALGDTLRPGLRTRDARLNAVDLGPTPTERPGFEWTGLGGSSQRSGRASVSAPASDSSTTAAVLDAEPSVYPNPMRNEMGSVAHIRFHSGADHTARLSIYSLEGQLLQTLPKAAQAGRTEEIDWDTRGLASGPYLCRLDFVGVDGARTDILTFYVER